MKACVMIFLCYLVAVVSVVLLVPGCGPNPAASYPSDQSLIDLFNANQANFAMLQTDPNNKAIHSLLGIKAVHGHADTIRFDVWLYHSPPGGAYKGFLYSEKPISPDLLVESIDKKTVPPISPEEKHLCRHIQSKWYLYYYSVN